MTLKKIIALLLISVLVFTGCDKAPEIPVAPESVPESSGEEETGYGEIHITMDREDLPGDAAQIGHIKAVDEKGEVLWERDTGECYIGQYDGLKEIGLSTFGYMYIGNNTLYCLDPATGDEYWTNDQVGQGVNWKFGDDGMLYTCAESAPDLMALDAEGEMHFQTYYFAEPFFWAKGLELHEDCIEVQYYSIDASVMASYKNGECLGVVPTSEDGLRQLLEGMWVDDVNDPRVYLGFDADGTLVAFNDTEMECYAYGGNWELECLEAGEGEVPDLIVLNLTDTGDPQLKGWHSMGDYIWTGFDIDEGTIKMTTAQANNGDSMMSIYYDEMSPTFYKWSDTVDYENPALKNAVG